MTIVMPSGYSNFNWSPKNTDLKKTASTGETEKTDKDLLYEAASKFVKAQFEAKEESEEKDEPSEEKSEDKGEKEDKGEEKSEDKGEKKDKKPCADKPCDDGKADAAPDVQKAVGELVEKAKKAEEIATKVQDAVAKVEQAVQEVKEVAGVVEGEVEGEIPGVVGDVDEVESDLGSGMEPPNEVEVELDMPGEGSQLLGGDTDLGGEMSGVGELADMGGMGDMGGGIEKEGFGAMASEANPFVRTASVSKETASKVTKFWKDYLGFPPEYVKLMVKNYEK